MPNWRRARIPGGTYFFTVVTEGRRPIFESACARQILGDTIRQCIVSWPFEPVAIVLLPDHLHSIWCLPEGDSDYSKRWAWIKQDFTKKWIAKGGEEMPVTDGKKRDGRRGVWQSKFWEHTIKDEVDFDRHYDYIHFNPVKHGYVRCPSEWEWSSFHRWVKEGVYPEDWACGDDRQNLDFRDIDKTVGE